ncbi:two-component sensor histidine kinase [Virgisporangium aliadipatigenens]|uniref:histidine kinase n=1 Tax=Virgisporangium aliadipatigenens TaxID=741659 RepID=A0A8J3YRV6_9ACTN|nr:HAMP domain-containing sensor histidine kinase [Virgisporangium aliadipatigenens]GIJ49263.1 two-component sensor histidine kinase [Virgisporangium aliadipatigenens]
MGRVPLRRSLLTRLLATSMLIAVCAIAATAWLTVQLTTRAVTREQSRNLSADTDVYDALIGYAATHRTWDGVDVTVRRLAELTGRRIVLTTPERRPLTGASDGAPGASAVPTANVDPLYLDAGLSRDLGGRIDPRAVGPYLLPAAERATLRATADAQVACLRLQGAQAKVEETPSGRPVVRMLSADVDGAAYARCPAKLLTPTATERPALEALTAVVRDCLGERGAGITVTPVFTLDYGAAAPSPPEPAAPDGAVRAQPSAAVDDRPRPAPDEEFARFARQCLEDGRREQLRPFVAPPALIFVTGPAAAAQPAVTLSPANTLRIAGTTGVILVLAFLATVLVGVRLVRPLRLLTDAASLPLDRQEPVPVTTRDEIGRLAAAFNDLSARRRDSERQRTAMVSDIAHELRTPLTNIRSWLEAARDGVTAVDPQVLDLLVEESVLLHHVVDDLRDLAAADAGKLRVHPEPTFVRDAVTQVLDAHRGAAEAAGVALLVDPEAADPEAIVDPVRLRQLVGNLVSNAVRHTPAGGSVTVRIALRDGRLIIDVCDTGGGIAAEDLPRVFERFWRADTSRSRETGGSGLGLSIARQIARAHAGDLTVTSEPGVGTVFTVDIAGS